MEWKLRRKKRKKSHITTPEVSTSIGANLFSIQRHYEQISSLRSSNHESNSKELSKIYDLVRQADVLLQVISRPDNELQFRKERSSIIDLIIEVDTATADCSQFTGKQYSSTARNIRYLTKRLEQQLRQIHELCKQAKGKDTLLSFAQRALRGLERITSPLPAGGFVASGFAATSMVIERSQELDNDRCKLLELEKKIKSLLNQLHEHGLTNSFRHQNMAQKKSLDDSCQELLREVQDLYMELNSSSRLKNMVVASSDRIVSLSKRVNDMSAYIQGAILYNIQFAQQSQGKVLDSQGKLLRVIVFLC